MIKQLKQLKKDRKHRIKKLRNIYNELLKLDSKQLNTKKEQKHFPLSRRNYIMDNEDGKKYKSIILNNMSMYECFKNKLLPEMNRRINLLEISIQYINDIIERNNKNEMKLWINNNIAFTKEVPNIFYEKTIIEEIYGSNKLKGRYSTYIIITTENIEGITLKDFEINKLCNYYLLCKNKENNKWNLFMEYNPTIYAFSNRFHSYINKNNLSHELTVDCLNSMGNYKIKKLGI